MDKVGVITWVDGSNFGGFLQAFATNTHLKEKGIKPVFIKLVTTRSKFKHFLGMLCLLFLRPDIMSSRIKKRRLLKKEIYVKEFISYNRLKEYSKSLSFCICGSDQIWNIDGIEKDKFVLLDFVEPQKRVSFSPSISHTSLSQKAIQLLKLYLPSFRRISIREKNGYDIIKKNTGLEPELLFDPIYMFDANSWGKMTSGSFKAPKNPYILVYLLNDNDFYYELIEKYAKKVKIDVIQVNLKREVHPRFKTKKCDPFGFVQLIQNANYVFTDSFHGLSFSLILNKSFTIFRRFKDDEKSENSRIYNLLNYFNLFERLISDDNFYDISTIKLIYDFTSINEKIRIQRNKLINYLDEVCEGRI